MPSLPGFAFSGPTREAGWTTGRIARAFAELMRRLGYERYGVQGGDWGSFVAAELGRVDREHVIGVHLNGPTMGFIPFGPVSPEEAGTFTDAERARLKRLQASTAGPGNGYFEIQAQGPQTIAYALNDSPVGQLAWIVEKFREWGHAASVPEDVIDRDHMLTNVMLYWLTVTAGSAARLYYETSHAAGWNLARVEVPTGVAVFAEDFALRRYGERGTISCTGPSSTGADTSRRWRSRTSSPMTCGRSSGPSGARVRIPADTASRRTPTLRARQAVS